MRNKNFVKEVKIKVEFSELSQKAFTKTKQFLKLLSMENSILLKGLKKLQNCWCSDVFCIIYMGNHSVWTDIQCLVIGLTEPSEFGCKLMRYFYCSRCNCSCLTFCTNYKYERDRTLGDRPDSDQFRRGNGPSQFVYFQPCFENVHTTRSCDTV